MREIDKIYVDGAFITPHGQETFDLYNPSTGKVIGQVRLADEVDARAAIAAAKRAFPSWSRTSKDERIAALQRLRDAVAAKREALLDAVAEEYGAPMPRCSWMADMSPAAFQEAANTLQEFEFTRRAGSATVVMEPIGVAGLIHAVEQRCRIHLRKTRCRPCRRMHGGPQTERDERDADACAYGGIA